MVNMIKDLSLEATWRKCAVPLKIHTPRVDNFVKVYHRVCVIFSNAPTFLILCAFYFGFITEGVNILFRSVKRAYLLEIDTPPERDVS